MGIVYPPALQQALAELNPAQLKVARLLTSKAAILGVPGSGKTRALINMLACRIAEGCPPDRILAMTFTRNAASEMNERLFQMGITGARVGTIHSVCNQILREGCGPMIAELTLDLRNRMSMELKKLINSMQRSKKLRRRGLDRGAVINFISECKATGCAMVNNDPFGINIRLMDALYDKGNDWEERAGVEGHMLVDIYLELESRRANRGLFNYDDMLLWAWMLLICNPFVLLEWRNKYDYVIVDEAQDSNPVQWDIANLIAGGASCIFRDRKTERKGTGQYITATADELIITEDGASLYVFGDPSQGIYKFRSAAPELFTEFALDKSVTKIALPFNYRSTPGICAVGSEIVQGKDWHLCGTMIATGAASDADMVKSMPKTISYRTPEEEASKAVKWAMEHAATHPEGLDCCAILSRTSLALNLCEVDCIRQRIPYRKMASGTFFGSKEVRDMMNYLKVASGLDYDGASFRSIINTPFRFIGRPFILNAEANASTAGISLMDAMHEMRDELSHRVSKNFDKLIDLLQDLNEIAIKAVQAGNSIVSNISPDNPGAIIGMVLDRTEYIDALRSEEGLGEDDYRLASLYELQRMASLFQTPAEFSQYVDAIELAVSNASSEGLKKKDSSNPGQPVSPCLTLSTIHRFKGLEKDKIRIIDVNSGRFPHKLAPDLDEELRLLYVAITRAKTECVLTNTAGIHDADEILCGMDECYMRLVNYAAETVTSSENHKENRIDAI